MVTLIVTSILKKRLGTIENIVMEHNFAHDIAEILAHTERGCHSLDIITVCGFVFKMH